MAPLHVGLLCLACHTSTAIKQAWLHDIVVAHVSTAVNHVQGTPGNQAPTRPGEFAYEPQAPKNPVTQEDVDSQQAKACR